jgi:hypothetical protein
MFGRDHFIIGVCCPACKRSAAVKVSKDTRWSQTGFEVDAMPEGLVLLDGGNFIPQKVKMRCKCGAAFYPWSGAEPVGYSQQSPWPWASFGIDRRRLGHQVVASARGVLRSVVSR